MNLHGKPNGATNRTADGSPGSATQPSSLPPHPPSRGATLTQSQSYEERLSLSPVSSAPGQVLLSIESRLSHAADPAGWRLRHQVIVTPEALSSLREAIDRFLLVSARHIHATPQEAA